MSNSSEIRVSIVAESTPGVTPVSPAMLVLPTSGQSLQPLCEYVDSLTIQNNRNYADSTLTRKSSSGRIPCELRWAASGEALFAAIQAVMCTTEVAEVTIASCSTTAAAKTVTRASGSFVSDGVLVGDLVKLYGASVAADNGWVPVTAVSALSLTVERGSNFTGSTGDVSVKRGGRMDNGATHRHYSIEVSRLDIGKHAVFKKCVFNDLAIRWATGQLTTADFGIAAGDVTFSDTPVGASYTDPVARPLMSAVQVPLLKFGGVEYECSEVSVSMTNNAIARSKIGLETSVGTIRRGRFGVTGTNRWFYDGPTELLKYATNLSSSGVVVAQDETGAAWGLSMPRMKYQTAAAPTDGPDQDDEFRGDFRAIVHPTDPYTLRLQRFSA